MIPGEICWVDIPAAAAHEQGGRRPAVVLQDDGYAGRLPLVIVVPLTSAVAAARLAGTLVLEPTPENGLRKQSVVLVFQIRALDRRMVRDRLGSITPEQLAQIHCLLDRLTGRATPQEPDNSDHAG